MTVFLTDHESVMVLGRSDKPKDSQKSSQFEQAVVRMTVEGAKTVPRFEGLEKTRSISNYFIGDDPLKWVTDVPNYTKVRVSDVYSGIDVVYYGDGRKLEYDFIVRPGADPDKIRLSYSGADFLTTDSRGDLLIATRVGTLVQHKPKVYQKVGGKRREIEVSYRINGGAVEFALAHWDHSQELVIDPTLAYSTYLGGSGDDTATSIAVQNGLIYLAGRTQGGTFPLGALPTNSSPGRGSLGNYDAFVSKIDPNQSGTSSLIYTTYLSGNTNDEAWGVAADSSGNAYVTGFTESDDFPKVNANKSNRQNRDAFVSKLNPAGNTLLYSTLFGGTDDEKGRGIVVDGNGTAYISGYSKSQGGNFPSLGTGSSGCTKNTDVFFAVFSSAGVRAYSTCVGASDDVYDLFNNPNLRRQAIAIDLSGGIYIAGTTNQQISGLSSLPGGLNGFAMKWTTASGRVWASYIVNTNNNQTYGTGIAADSTGVYVTGYTNASSVPTSGSSYGGGWDAYAAKLDLNTGANIGFVYVGGTGNEYGSGIATDGSGGVYITGWTSSSGVFPATDGTGTRTGPGDSWDAFVAQISFGSATLPFATRLFSGGNDYSYAIAVSTASVYIAGGASPPAGILYPAMNAYNANFSGGNDAFVTVLGSTPRAPTTLTVTGGGSQTTPVNTAFSNLQARVTNGATGLPDVRVTLTAPNGAGAASALLGGSGTTTFTTTTDSNGNVSIGAIANGVAAGPYNVVATLPDYPGVASVNFSLTNTAGAVSAITFVQQPPNTPIPAGTGFPVQVQLKDSAGNLISNTSVALSLYGSAETLYGYSGPVMTNGSGVATFTGLNVHSAGTYFLQASAGGLTAQSTSFTIIAGAAVSIVIVGGNLQTTGAGMTFASPLLALVEDVYGNPIPGVPVTFMSGSGPTTGTFNGPATVTTNTAAPMLGIATSPTLTAVGQIGTFMVTATTPGAAPVTFTLNVAAGTASKLAFSQQPSSTIQAGTTFSPSVAVQVQDSFGNPITTGSVQISLALQPMATLFGTVAQTSNSGIALFPDINIHQAGQYSLLASATGVDSAVSTSFTVTAGAAATITATGGTPQSAQIQTAFLQPLQVAVTDAYSNPVSGVTVTFTPPGSGAAATLSSPATTDANGHTSVTATANNVAAAYAVTASAAGVSGNASFALTNTSGPPGTVSFVTQPTNTAAGNAISPAGPVVVLVADGGGNPLSGQTVTMSLEGSAVTLGGTLTAVTDANGHATFSDLTITVTGAYQLLAATSSISAPSNSFTITPQTSSVLISVFSGNNQSAAVNTGYSAPLIARVTDAYGNPGSGVPVTFSAPGTGASVSGLPAVPVTSDTNGYAVSPAIIANGTTGNLSITATATGASSPAIFAETNLGAGANKLSFVQQPTDTTTGAALLPAVTVQLQDSTGNSVHTSGVLVAIQSTGVVPLPGRALRSPNATQLTDANGVATFATLSYVQTGTYQLQATASSVASATSHTFNITAGRATTIQATGGTPQSAVVQTVYGAPLQVTITDANGTPISGVTVTFTAPTTGASGLFGGQSTLQTITDAQGHARATVTANNISGTFGVTAYSEAVSGSVEFQLTNLPAGSSTLAFVQQPTNTPAGQSIAPPVTVSLQTSSGLRSSTAGVPVILSLSSGTGTLFGTVVQLTDITGLATFPNLSIGQTGTKQLLATAIGVGPATSNSFQITAGSAASIIALSGTPQYAIVSQSFELPLQARVLDIAGNPVSGASVTFAIPGSGPGGSFGGSTTVTTDSSGVATASTLTANSTVGSFVVNASVAGVSAPAVFSLTNLPAQQSGITVSPQQLYFVNELNQSPPPGQTVQISNAGSSTVSWTAVSSASWLTVLPASGTAPSQVTVSVNPVGLTAGTYTGSIRIADGSGGVSVVLVTYLISDKTALVITPPVLVFSTASNTVAPSAQTLTSVSTSRQINYNVSVNVSTPTNGTWLHVSPASGQTTGTVQVSVTPTGLNQGLYNGSVLFSPTDNSVNSVAVPVTLIVGCPQGGCILQPNILAIVNTASFYPNGAPGAAMSIVGTDLSDSTYQAQTYPLPAQLGPTQVLVNGNAAPLYYASPTLINFQMPTVVPASTVQVTVSNSSPGFQSSPQQAKDLLLAAPGLFVTPDGRAAARNGDLSLHTALTPVPAGSYIVLFITGQGPVNPPVADGQPAPLSPLSPMTSSLTVTIGGKNAQFSWAGLAPNYAGLSSINAIVPSGLTSGDQPVFVTINGIPSNAGLITVK